MDTNQETAQIPEFQLAKVGERRRRKGGALPWFGGSGAGSHGGGGIFGTVSGIASQSALKICIMLLAGALGAGAYTIGKDMRPDASKFERKPAPFAFKNEKPEYSASDLANLPGGSAPAQSSVGMAFGSLDGLTPEQRAAKAAKEAADAKAAAEAQAKADAEAKAKEAASVPGVGAPDPAALAAAAAAAKEKEKEQAFNHRFGELSKGSGLSGGAGLGGGIGRSFEPMNISKKGGAGVLSSLGSSRGGAGSAASKITAGRNPGRSLAQRQLNRAVRSAAQTKAGANESRSTAAQIPFDTGSGSGQLLTGAGGATGAGLTSGKADTNPSATGGGGTPVSSGGSSGSGDDDCNLLASKYGWEGEFVNSANGGCVREDVAGTGAQDPTNMYFRLLAVLAALGTLIGAILLILSLTGTGGDGFQPATWTLVKILGGALIAIGAIESILGMMVVGMGRTIEGGIFTLLGAGTAVAGYLAYAQAGREAGDKMTFLGNQIGSLVTGLVTACQAGGVAAGMLSKPRTYNSDTNQWQ